MIADAIFMALLVGVGYVMGKRGVTGADVLTAMRGGKPADVPELEQLRR